MGSVASAVSEVFEDVGQAVGDVVESVPSVVSEAVQNVNETVDQAAQQIGKAGADLDNTVNNEIPGGWVTVGLVAGTIATAGALGAGSFGTLGTGSASQAASAASAATSFAGASSSTAASVATGVLQSAATGALKGAAVGGISAALQGDSILEGVMSGAGSGALGGAVGGINQALPFNPFVEQAFGNVAKSAATGNLDNSLDKIAFNALAGYAGSELGLSPSIAVPGANLARAAAEGKDISKALQNTAINYAVGKVANEAGKQLGGAFDEFKQSIGGGGGGGSDSTEEPTELSASDKALNFAKNAVETSAADYLKDLAKQQLQPQPQPRMGSQSNPKTNLNAQELMAQGYAWDQDRQVWTRPGASQPTQQPSTSGQLTPEQLTEMGYTWNEERQAYGRPKPIDTALDEYKDPYESLNSPFENKEPLTLQQQLAQMGYSFSPEEKSLNTISSISPYDDTFNFNEPERDYAIDRSLSEYKDPISEETVLGEYVDPMLKRQPTTNIMAGGAPLQTGSGLTATAGFAEGGTTGKDKETENSEFIDRATEDIFRYMRPGVSHGSANYNLPGYPFGQLFRIGMAQGGAVEGHNPQFFSEGGLNSLGNTYVKGEGDGTSDSIPAMLANGEFVIPADVVSGLGNGSNDSGAKVLDEFLKTIRKHKQKTGAEKLPPDSKGPLGYLLEAKRKMKV
jgi:hypothetical protein